MDRAAHSTRYAPFFFALELADGLLKFASGMVTYHPAFDAF
ncbi:MAG: hypothetical protein WBW88_04160 [Rhodothermales bacterium]